MTTQRLSSEKLFDAKLFKNLFRRRLPHLLVAFLVNFFTVCVPIMLWSDDIRKGLSMGTLAVDRYIDRAVRNMGETMVLNLVFMFVLGIYFGIITLGYMMKRRSAHFYHALPQTRETLYTTSVANALTCVAIGGAAAIVIALIQLAVNELFIDAVIAKLLFLLAKNILYFLVAYAITVFAGSFSGNGLVQTLMSLVIMFYPFATYAGFVAIRSIHTNYFWTDFYLSQEMIEWLSPVIYVGYHYNDPFGIFTTVVAVLVIAALLLGGMAIYKKRAIECSERPIVFKKLGEVLKYALMFVITVYAAMFFEAIGYTDFHMIFGILCGSLLSWMLFNTILAKSPKAMFKGVKGLLVFLLVFALFTAVVCYDIVGYDNYVPAENNIKQADIVISNVEFDDTRFTDAEILASLSRLLKNQQKANEAGFCSPLSGTDASFVVNTVIYNKLGVPVARTYRVSKYTEGAAEFLKLYADCGRLAEEYSKTHAALRDIVAKEYDVELHISCNNYKADLNLYGDVSASEFRLFVETYLREHGEADYDRVSKPIVGTVEVTNIGDDMIHYYSLYEYAQVDWSWSELPVYADMTDTIKLLGIKPAYAPPYTYENEKEIPLPIASAVIYDTRELYYSGVDAGIYSTGLGVYPYKEITEEHAEALANMLAWYNQSSYSSIKVFTEIDTDYILKIYYGSKNAVVEDYYVYDEYGLKYSAGSVEVIADTKEQAAYSSETFLFPKGYVPESVKALFE